MASFAHEPMVVWLWKWKVFWLSHTLLMLVVKSDLHVMTYSKSLILDFGAITTYSHLGTHSCTDKSEQAP
jgi:hypothetical protein